MIMVMKMIMMIILVEVMAGDDGDCYSHDDNDSGDEADDEGESDDHDSNIDDVKKFKIMMMVIMMILLLRKMMIILLNIFGYNQLMNPLKITLLPCSPRGDKELSKVSQLEDNYLKCSLNNACEILKLKR